MPLNFMKYAKSTRIIYCLLQIYMAAFIWDIFVHNNNHPIDLPYIT